MKSKIVLTFLLMGLLCITSCEKEEVKQVEGTSIIETTSNDSKLKTGPFGSIENYIYKAVAGDGEFSNAFLIDPVPCDIGAPETTYNLTIEELSLCPSYEANVNIWICGQLYTSYLVQPGDAPLMNQFVVPCDCEFYLEVILIHVNGIKCKKTGSVSATLTLP